MARATAHNTAERAFRASPPCATAHARRVLGATHRICAGWGLELAKNVPDVHATVMSG